MKPRFPPSFRTMGHRVQAWVMRATHPCTRHAKRFGAFFLRLGAVELCALRGNRRKTPLKRRFFFSNTGGEAPLFAAVSHNGASGSSRVMCANNESAPEKSFPDTRNSPQILKTRRRFSARAIQAGTLPHCRKQRVPTAKSSQAKRFQGILRAAPI